MKLKKHFMSFLLAFFLPIAAFADTAAAAPDVSSVTDFIKSCAAPAAAVGGAVMILLIGIKVYKWIRSAAS